MQKTILGVILLVLGAALYYANTIALLPTFAYVEYVYIVVAVIGIILAVLGFLKK